MDGSAAVATAEGVEWQQVRHGAVGAAAWLSREVPTGLDWAAAAVCIAQVALEAWPWHLRLQL